MKKTDTVTNPNQRNLRRASGRILIPSGSPEDWSRLDSVSDDYRPDWWFSFPPSWVLVTSSVGGERLYRWCLAWELVWGRDQEAAGQGERGGEGDQGH